MSQISIQNSTTPNILFQDSSAVQDQLQQVESIHSSNGAFAALRSETCRKAKRCIVVGSAGWSNYQPAKRQQGYHRVTILNVYYPASPKTTVHRTEDGSVVAWGEAERGGDCSKVKDQLYDIQQLAGSGHSMASVRVWLELE